MPILREYLESIKPGIDDSKYIEYCSGLFINELDHLLNNILIEEKSEEHQKPVPGILVSKLSCCYHNEAIDTLLDYMNNKNINNSLLLGQKVNEEGGNSMYTFKGFNSSIRLLKSKSFEIIKTIVGDEMFLNMILNTNAIWIPNKSLIWGDIKITKYNVLKKPNCISVKGMLYVYSKNIKKTNPLPNKSWDILRKIFKQDALNDIKRKNDPPKRFRKVFRLIKIMLMNHNSQMKTYPYIVDQICGNQKKTPNNFSFVTSKDRVIQFVMTIVYLIIPAELFGTSSNRAKIMRYIPTLINSTIHYRQPVQNLLLNIKINEINWLKPRNDIKLTKMEFIRAKKMFSSFLLWFFNIFVCKIIGAFFHVTGASQTNRLMFYRHHTWLKISKRYMSQYFKNHLVNAPDMKNSYESFKQNKDFIGSLNLQPKKNSFRLIVKPFRGTKAENIEYLVYKKRVLRPINLILNTIRLRNSCSSVIEIVNSIYAYKQSLLEKYNNKLPTIYAYKFDVKNAYDSLPHSIIDKVVRERLDSFTKNKTLYVQILQELHNDRTLKISRNIVVDALEKLYPFTQTEKIKKSFSNRKRVLVDVHETLNFTKSEIMEFVQKQYRNTCFHTRTRSYYRKIGVYQGFPISGTLFNMVYDSLVSELYEKVNQHSETKIIRLMDDFLVLSTDENNIHVIRKYTARCIKTYNLNINRLKTKITKSDLTFTGLSIDLTKLICYKKLADYNNSPIHVSSFKKLYQSLIRYIHLWVRGDGIFDPSNCKSELEGFKKNLFSLLKSILFKFTNSYKLVKVLDKFSLKDFYEFSLKAIEVLAEKVSLQSINFNFNKLWLTSLKILYHKGILHKNLKRTLNHS
jgi:telomerase reverse transcriptase